MSRTASLKPYKSTTSPNRPWCVDVPASLSELGKRQRLFFETERLAKVECEVLKARKENFGVSLTALTPSRIAEASEAFNLLHEASDTSGLLVIVREYLKAEKRRTASVSFARLFDQYIESRGHLTPPHLRKILNCKDRFPELQETKVSDIGHADLEPVLQPLPPAMRNAQLRYLKAVFNFGKKRGWLEANPIDRLDFREIARKEVETVPSSIVRKMLDHALENDLELVPFLTLGFFAGIRPHGELERLEWRDIDLKDKIITIRPEVSKTKRRRFPELSPNAVAWLNAYASRGGKRTGKVMPLTFHALREKRRANWEASAGKGASWIQQGMRHTYCSNWLAANGDVNKLVLLSGHDSVETMWRNYHRGTKKGEAKKFWLIRPAKPARNVIEFAKVG
jgi:integrase